MRLHVLSRARGNRVPVGQLLAAVAIASSLTLPAAAQRAIVPPPTPVLISSGQYDVALLTHASAAGLSDPRRGAEWFRACRTQLSIPASDSLAVVRSQPWEWSADAVTDPGSLTLLVSRTPRQAIDCGASAASTAIAYARGFRVTADTAYPYDATITEVNVFRGETRISSALVERVAATRVTLRGLITVPAALLRLSLPIDDVAPDSLGRVSDLELEIVSPDSSLPHRVAIPWSQLRPVWEQLLRARAERRSAELAGTVTAPLATLARAEASAADRLDAQVRVGDAFARAGDLNAARVVLGHAVQEEPCLTLAATMDATSRGIVDRVARPRDRCTANLPLVVGRATLVPGFGQLQGTRRKLYAVAVLSAVAGTLAASQSSNDKAKALYAQYLAVEDPSPVIAAVRAGELYDEAESKRLTGRNLVIAGATIWGASLLEATFSEQRLAARLARVRDYSTARRVSVAPYAGSDRVGLAVTFF
jgi:hypothetical protein